MDPLAQKWCIYNKMTSNKDLYFRTITLLSMISKMKQASMFLFLRIQIIVKYKLSQQ